jgi:hypothetical protein
MKNLSWQDTKSKRLSYIKEQFSSQRYFENKDLLDLIENAATYPILWYDYTDISVERLHFSVWWGAIARRNNVYNNLFIKDLYLLHELSHFVEHARYPTGTTFDTWTETRLGEEDDASFFSEMDIYNLCPWLREKTFDFPILWDECREKDKSAQFAIRKHAGLAEGSPAMQLAAKYKIDNKVWCELWKDERQRVEEWFADLIETKDMSQHILRLSSVAENNIPWLGKALLWKDYLQGSK